MTALGVLDCAGSMFQVLLLERWSTAVGEATQQHSTAVKAQAISVGQLTAVTTLEKLAMRDPIVH